MQYNFENKGRYAVLSVQEEKLHYLVAPELKSKFVELAKQEEKISNLILDLSGVDYVDSSGLSAILTGNRLWQGNNGSFVITGVESPSVQKLIEISRLETVLTIMPTLEESVDFVMMEDIERELNADLDGDEEKGCSS